MTINTHKGLYRTSRLAYDVKTAPSTFQCVMDQILSGIEGVCCFVDDMLAFSETKEQYIELLEKFFSWVWCNIIQNLCFCVQIQYGIGQQSAIKHL